MNRKTAPTPRGGIQHALAVEVHRGSNVDFTSNTDERDEALPTPPSAKRRKLDHQTSPSSSGQTDPLDQLSPHAVSFHAGKDISHPHTRPPSASANSQTSGVPMKRDGSFEYRREHKIVEKMMDSRPKSKKPRHNDSQDYQADYFLLPSSPKTNSSRSHPIDISGDESQSTKTNSQQVPRHAYPGTARKPPSAVNGTRPNSSKSVKERVGPAESPFFTIPEPPAFRSNGNIKQKLVGQNSIREKSPGLARKFVAADGTRRGSDVNASSDADELQSAPTTVGQNADPDAVFTVEDMRPSSPSKKLSSTLKATSPTDDLAVWAPSTIKSDFASANLKSRNGGRPSRPLSLKQEAEPPWSAPLAAISLSGRLYKSEDLGLVYDQKSGGYLIMERGSAIATTLSSLRIQPKKLIKIVWATKGGMVRLESSRSGTEDNMLDLELASERDLSDLVRRLATSNNLSVQNKTRYVVRALA